ncbi:MAG: efflux RND transporter permease subunit, partial [Rhizobacter sp.]|nr:efflux RND transporter permease subunit [Chlorobiales bacterium]
ANAVDVSKLVRAEVAKIEKDYAGIGLRFDIAQDGSLFTLDAAHAVQEDLMIAIVLVALVMLVFLHSFRNSFIVMVSIPASLISTFGLMYLFGFSLNLMTLLGLSLAVGIWVDDSIVVLENIYRRLEMGDDQRTAAIKGRDEIGFTALSITLVDVVVFLPLSFVGGIVGNIFREFALVIVGSTLISLLVSFTITPVLASRITKLEHMTKDTLMGRFSLWFEAQFNRFVEWYLSILKWALGNGWKVAALVVVLLIGSFSLFPLGFIGGEFITQSDRGEFSVALELPPGAKFEQTNAVTLQAERIIMDMQGEVEKVSTTVGASADGFVGQSANNITDITVALVPKDKRTRSTAEIQQDIKLKLLRIPGLKARVNEIGIFGTANQTPIQLGVGGTDPDSVRKGANHLADIVRSIKGTTDVRLSSEDGKPETRVEIDRQKMAAVGLTVAEVGGALRVALAGDTDAKFRDGQNEYDIRIGLDEFDRSKTANVGGLTFVNNRGQLIELQQFASIITGSGPTKLQRADRNSNILVYSQVAGKPSGSIWAEVQQAVAKSPLPGGTRISLYGDLKSQSEANSSLGLAFLAGILFMYMIMVALYDSYLWPLVVLFSIPLAVIGAFLALALAAKSMNIFTILGFLMLIGLVAKNAILLVDFTNKSREEGFSTFDALIESGKERLRPILMTTLTMILGMLPIALSQSAGSEWKTGLAWALIGGLTSSMFLTLVVVPTVYITFDGLKSSIPAFFRRLVKRSEPAPQGVPQPLAGARFSEVKP